MYLLLSYYWPKITVLIEDNAHMKTNIITTGDGKRIAYSLDGPKDAPVVLLLNSIATTMHMWDGNLDDFVHTYQVLRYDFRGHGESDAPAEPYSIDRFGYDVIELLDALNIDTVDVIGLSLGGLVAQWLAIYAPERVRKLVLANTFAYLSPRSERDELIIKAQHTTDMAGFADMFMANWFPTEMLKSHDPIIEPFRQVILTMSPQGLAGALAVVRDTDYRRVIKLIQAPTLVIGGQYDIVTTLELSEEIAASIPHAQLEVLPGSHLSNVQFPERFAQIVLQFLAA